VISFRAWVSSLVSCTVQVTYELLKLHLVTGVHKSPAPGRRADNFTVVPKIRGSSVVASYQSYGACSLEATSLFLENVYTPVLGILSLSNIKKILLQFKGALCDSKLL
jgi:hypothetical protein